MMVQFDMVTGEVDEEDVPRQPRAEPVSPSGPVMRPELQLQVITSPVIQPRVHFIGSARSVAHRIYEDDAGPVLH